VGLFKEAAAYRYGVWLLAALDWLTSVGFLVSLLRDQITLLRIASLNPNSFIPLQESDLVSQ